MSELQASNPATTDSAAPPAVRALTFSAQVIASDALCASWLAEATLRLRREICWLWHLRAGTAQPAEAGIQLPPRTDSLVESLELARFHEDKQRMFATDPTARYLTQQIEALRTLRRPAPGPWHTLVERLSLDEGAQLILSLGLLAHADPASAAVFAACHNDPARTLPSFALAQRLGDGAEISTNSGRRLFNSGVLSVPGEAAASGGAGWQQPYELSPLLAEAVLRDDGRLPAELRLPPKLREPVEVSANLALAANVLRQRPRSAEIVPLLGDRGCDFIEWGTALAKLQQRTLVMLPHEPLPEPALMSAIAAWCWLYDVDVLLPLHRGGHEHLRERSPLWPQAAVRWLVPVNDPASLNTLPQALLKPAIRLPATDFHTRVRRLHRVLGRRAQGCEAAIEEMARRFRLGPAAIDAVGAAAESAQMLDANILQDLCSSQTHSDLGSLAQRVEPRFALQDIVLPPAQLRQLGEIIQATRALTRVHYRWGTARVWNDAGLSVVFCGPPGTGKTMAAEVLAHELQLPMFRIDLSQVVNKYIGETEKNLARVFDAAEESDCVIFFDEADALFGKRTTVKDAHDRFANIEISYLLERMERLKGIAVLATNRRTDLDEAFLRRRRYLVEFPLPGERERERLWRNVFPPGVNTAALDFAALARLFPLAGGHIRSIAFNACLQAAGEGEPAIEMAPVLFAVKRELDKLNRPNAPEDFGPFQSLVRPLFLEAGA